MKTVNGGNYFDNEDVAGKFIKNPDTRVLIDYNNELGYWRYSICVEDSDGFWLDSFETEDEAKAFIETNNLKYA